MLPDPSCVARFLVLLLASLLGFPDPAVAVNSRAVAAVVPPSAEPGVTPGGTAQPEPQSFRSQILGRDVPFDILFPPGYAPDATNRYPVLYWLPDSAPARSQFALQPRTIHDAIRQRIIPPILVVYVREGASSFYTDAASGLAPASTLFVHELVPAVDRAFRTVANRQNRALQGIGRGGFGAFRLALAHPETFGSAASFSGPFHSADAFASDPALRDIYRETFGAAFERAATNHPAFLAESRRDRIRDRIGLRLVVGRQDRFLAENRALRDTLRDAKLTFEWSETTDPLPADAPLPEPVALDALEFAVSWLGQSRSPDRDGPWINPPASLPPRIRHHVVYSELLERPVGYSLYLPPGYAPNASNGLPVLYHLHGRNEDETRHLETTGYLDVSLQLAEVTPFAWVWLYGGRGSWFTDSSNGRVPAQSVLLEEVIPQIEDRWNLGGSPSRRALDGWGMGAFGALRFASLNPPIFGAALIHNPLLPNLATLPDRFPDAWVAVFNADPRYFSSAEPFHLLSRNAETLRPLIRFRVVSGERSPSLPDARRLHEHLTNLMLIVEYEVVPDMAGTGPDLFRKTGLSDIRFLGRALNRSEK